MVTDTSRRQAGNLPAEVTTFVDRRRDLAEVEQLLASVRLVTLTGVGGVGKSRLALRIAARRRRGFRDGAWLVELAAVRDADLVAHTVAEALLLGEQSGRPPLDMLADFLRDRQLCIVLDNCEHLPEACAELVHVLLRAAPELKILATSRQSLGVVGEHVWPVPPLPAPDPDQSGQRRTGESSAALELFADRAAARSGFTMTPENQRDAARVCYLLDGIPLGIELAAVWLRTLALPQLAARLDDRFGLLTRGDPAVLPRHQTLRAAVEWSYDLCSAPERLLWARTSVFAGGLDLAAAEAVCAGGELAADAVFPALDGLVDKSVLLREERDGRVRFRLLETLREYGLERLREADEEPALRRRHRDYYRQLAEHLDAQWYGPDQLDWLSRLHAEHANLRTALEYCVTQPGEARVGLRMAADLWFYWLPCGQLREGRYWLDRALAADPGPSRERAGALAVNGYLAFFQEDTAVGEAMLVQARPLARQVDAASSYARATMVLGVAATNRMEVTRATELIAEAMAGFAALVEPDSMEPFAKLNVALFLASTVDPVRGVEHCAEQCRSSEARGELWALSWAHLGLAQAEGLLGRLGEATYHARQALRGKWLFRDAVGILTAIERLALVTSAADDHEQAAVLLGAARQCFQYFGLPVFEVPRTAGPRGACEAKTRNALGDAAYELAYRRGTGFSLEEAIAFALGEEPANSEPAKDEPAARAWATASELPTALTERERQVAELVADGLSNRHIAARLLIAQRTAESHVEHILTKLGFSSRAQIATWITEQKRSTPAN